MVLGPAPWSSSPGGGVLFCLRVMLMCSPCLPALIVTLAVMIAATIRSVEVIEESMCGTIGGVRSGRC